MPQLRTLSVLLVVLCCGACGSPAPKPAPAAAPAAKAAPGASAAPAAAPAKRPWPADFASEALLIADVVQIEGPLGLLDHVAVRQEGDSIAYKAETTTNGFLQTWTPKPGVEVRGQLDNYVIVALQRLTVLERPGLTSVEIRATNAVRKGKNADGWSESRAGEWTESHPIPEP